MKRLVLCGAVLALAAMAAPVQAAGAVYLGGGYGQTDADVEAVNSPFDIDDEGWKIYAGWAFTRFLAVEGGYTRLGDFRATNSALGTVLEADGTAFPLYAVVTLPLGSFEIFGKAGATAFDFEADVDDGDSRINDDSDGVDFAYGGGLMYNVVPGFLIRVEYERFDLENTDGVSFVSLGLQLRF